MKQTRQLYDEITGPLITVGVDLGYDVNPRWLLLPGILGVSPCFKVDLPGSARSSTFWTGPVRRSRSRSDNHLAEKPEGVHSIWSSDPGQAEMAFIHLVSLPRKTHEPTSRGFTKDQVPVESGMPCFHSLKPQRKRFNRRQIGQIRANWRLVDSALAIND